MKKEQFIAQAVGISEQQVTDTVALLEDGCTIPFIARYRKERTRGLDEVQIAHIRDVLEHYNELENRRKYILSSIENQGALTDALKEKLLHCFDLKELEDLYLPYKPKRKSRADEARKQGLEPLAKQIMAQQGIDPGLVGSRYIKGPVINLEQALSGARDIMAEWINENVFLRKRLRNLFEKRALLTVQVVAGKEAEADVYKDYFKHQELLRYCPSHRLLAILRGVRQGFLKIKALPEKGDALELMNSVVIRGKGLDSAEVEKAVKDAYTRLLAPSLENELLSDAKIKADEDAIQVFSKNLKNLLLAPPLGQKRVLALDPGFRTGCKLVCLDEQGNLLHNETVFPHAGGAHSPERTKASSKIVNLVSAYKIDALAIGDGTAGRETEDWIKHLRFDRDVQVFVVREDGASIYSASTIARNEFPNHDVTVRGAVSIGRRLIDPLAELVKIEPKSLGIGQYQHDVDQKKLKAKLDEVVVSAVNEVGVDVNTASASLLQYVSGLNTTIAENIVEYRRNNGAFRNRNALKLVARLGAKTFEQAAGFLRIKQGDNPLDNTAVHPESYELVKTLAKSQNITLSSLIGNSELIDKLENDCQRSITEQDILRELRKPGRDPRRKIQMLNFSQNIRTISDLKVGMKLPGVVTNVTDFGAFINIGIKENGLIHKSQLGDSFVSKPSDYIALNEHVQVEVMSIDVDRKRIGLKRI